MDDTWRIGLLAGWLAGRRRVVALGSDVAEAEEEEQEAVVEDGDSC